MTWYNERVVLCEKYADITVDEDGKNAGDVVDLFKGGI